MAEWSKALVLGTSLFGGVGSNPTSVTILHRSGGLAQSVECVVRNDEAPGSKPGFSIVFAMRTGGDSGNRRGDCASYQCLHSLVVRTPLCGSGNPGSNPGAGIYLCTVGLVGYDACFTRRRSRVRTSDCVLTSIGRVAQMVEHGSNKPRVVGSSPTVTTSFPTNGRMV